MRFTDPIEKFTSDCPSKKLRSFYERDEMVNYDTKECYHIQIKLCSLAEKSRNKKEKK